MILLVASSPGGYPDGDENISVDPGIPNLIRETSSETDPGIHELDTALTRMLRNYAIDPDKIGILGNSAGGLQTAYLGNANPNVFSRIAPRTGLRLLEGAIPPPKATQFYFMAGVAEDGEPYTAMILAFAKRDEGYPVTIVLAPKAHTTDVVEAANLFRWFHESWAAPEQARRASRPSRVAPMPLLTATAVQQWTAFWTRFMQEPDSIRDTARIAHIKEVPMLVGQQPVLMLMTDIPALAATYPAVAADLKAAGLTARQAEAYRTTLLSTWTTIDVLKYGKALHHDIVGTVAPTSVLGKNMAFLRTQSELIKMLKAAKMRDSDRTWVNTP